ncbi:MAG: 50S ribosomal protein L2 [Candidatus Nanoarchaeia archaeon]|nr:50S ribosomal protein L2 [Candidatus Nanoarchaeia archaeon]
MGKRLLQQRMGKGSLTYRSPSHRYVGTLKHRNYDDSEKTGITEGKIVDLVNCPGHSAPLARVAYPKEQVLVPAPELVKVGDEVKSGAGAPVGIGNTLPLKNIPEGTLIYNIELQPGDGGKLARTAGSFARVVTKIGNKVVIELPSRKQKAFLADCRATIGVIAGAGAKEKPFMKAGKRWHAKKARGRMYPRTSGVAMNAVDHPFGCGRGRHVGRPKTVSRNAPVGRKVGLISSRRTGRKRK